MVIPSFEPPLPDLPGVSDTKQPLQAEAEGASAVQTGMAKPPDINSCTCAGGAHSQLYAVGLQRGQHGGARHDRAYRVKCVNYAQLRVFPLVLCQLLFPLCAMESVTAERQRQTRVPSVFWETSMLRGQLSGPKTITAERQRQSRIPFPPSVF